MAEDETKDQQAQAELTKTPPAADEQLAEAASAASDEGDVAEQTTGDVPASPAELPEEEMQPEAEAEQTTDQTPSQQSSIETESQVPPLPDFSNMLADAAAGSIDMLSDVDLNVKVELGRTQLTVDEILRLTKGYVVELDKLAGDPVDILVNEQLIARGEVLVVNDSFCVRVNEIIPGVSERATQNAT
jgi:flagellar motor switch protein FliN/FliY